MSGLFKNFGRLPAEYNERVHGPYNPSVYYGKKDAAFGDVKIGELGSWISRRNKSPSAVVGAISRGWWRWQFKYVHPIKAGLTPYMQLLVGTIALFYVINYEHLRYHKHFKHH